MDTLTQIALGGAVGEATLGRKVGNKAVLWGAVAGLIPDLDILAAPFMTAVERFTYHRSLTHSILFTLAMSPLFGILIARIHRRSQATWREWTGLFLLALGTHWMLDVLTTYGTQIFWPFSDARVAWDSIFIIDFFYSIPLMAAVITVLFLRRGGRPRALLITSGLAVTTLYLVAGLVTKSVAGGVFEREMERRNITWERYITTPTPTNIVLWRLLAQVEDGYYTGYYSLLDDDTDVDLTFVPANHRLLDGIREEWAVDRLVWFSRGYYRVSAAPDDGKLHFHNLIFGTYGGPHAREADDWVFSFTITRSPDGVVVANRERSFDRSGDFLRAYYRRALGETALGDESEGAKSVQRTPRNAEPDS